MPRLSNNEAAATGWTDYLVVKHSDLTADATTETITYPLEARSVLTGMAHNLTTDFSGGGTSTLVFKAGDGSQGDAFLTTTSVHTSATAIDASGNTGLLLIGDETANCARMKVFVTADEVDILFTCSGNVSLLDTGRMVFYFQILRMAETP